MATKADVCQLIPRRVSGMYKTCSLTMRNARNCGEPANWAVQDLSTHSYHWRCDAHKSVLRVFADGTYSEGNWTDTVLVSLPYWRH